MFICHCQAVTDRAIKAAIEAGARSVGEIGDECDAGTGCGGCHLALRQLLAEYRRERAVGLSHDGHAA